MKKAGFLLLLCFFLLAAMTVWGYHENQLLGVTTFTLREEGLPPSFDGFRIAQVSDLHNGVFGEGNRKLLEALKSQKPDIIAFTGDTIDSRKPNCEGTLAFLSEAASIAPCFYVTGNHESRLPDREDFLARIEALGVEVLRGEAVSIRRGEESVNILGVDDYLFFPGTNGKELFDQTTSQLEQLDRSGYDIALYHRPELAAELTELDIEVFLSGHAHGGQFRIPFLGPLIAPDQGFFPTYTEGVCDLGPMTLVVSRGLGNSLFPFRLNNPPEIVMVVLETDQ